MTVVPPFLACPECGGAVEYVENSDESLPPPFDSRSGTECVSCNRFFPIVDDIFVMWSDQVRRLQLGELADKEDLADKVKRANIRIYDDVTVEYGEHHDGSLPYAQTLLFLKAIANDFRIEKLPSEKSVLVDVGCATGVSLGLGSTGYDYTVGVDISIGNLRSVASNGHVAILADAERLPFAPSSIDMFTCFATLHHFPNPEKYVMESFRCLRKSGVSLIAGEPSQTAMKIGVVARAAWALRKPVYRFLGRFSQRFYMHRDKEQQRLNDLAEINRTTGGFSDAVLEQYLVDSGFSEHIVFHGTDPSGFLKYSTPPWQQLVLRLLSFQNPFRRSNWMNLTAIGRV